MSINRRGLLVAASACLVPMRAKADLYDDYINSVSRRPFASFLARTSDGALGKPGHSYCALGVELDNGLRVYERLFGYYPVGDNGIQQIKAVFSKTSGNLASTIKDIAWKVEYRIPTTDLQRTAALAVYTKWSNNDPGYNLFANGGKNCSSFAAEVAAAVGLKVPPGAGSKFPVDFMSELKKLNNP